MMSLRFHWKLALTTISHLKINMSYHLVGLLGYGFIIYNLFVMQLIPVGAFVSLVWQLIANIYFLGISAFSVSIRLCVAVRTDHNHVSCYALVIKCKQQTKRMVIPRLPGHHPDILRMS